MFERNLSQLSEWNTRTSDRQKLQTIYLLLIALSFMAAAVTALFSYSAGHTLLHITVWAIAVYVANAVVWALLQTFVIAKLPVTKTRKR